MANAELQELAKAVKILHRLASKHQTRHPWPLADLPCAGGTHLFLDGFLSTGGYPDGHIADLYNNHVLSKLDDPGLSTPVRAHTYNFIAHYEAPDRIIGIGYLAEDTYSPIETHVRALVRTLEIAAATGNVVITAYSMGTVVSTLALHRLLSENPALYSAFPALILLEPVLQPNGRLLEALRENELSPFSQDEIPSVVFDLCLQDSDTYISAPQRAAAAIPELLDRGLAMLLVIYSPHDEFVPYVELPDPRIVHDRTPIQAFGSDEPPDGVKTHFLARALEYNHNTICIRSKQYLFPGE